MFQEQALNALKLTNARGDSVLEYLGKQAQMQQQLQHQQETQPNGHPQKVCASCHYSRYSKRFHKKFIFQIQPPVLVPKLIRKPSIERELPSLQYHRGSPALDSGAGSSRSDSPHQHPHAGGKYANF